MTGSAGSLTEEVAVSATTVRNHLAGQRAPAAALWCAHRAQIVTAILGTVALLGVGIAAGQLNWQVYAAVMVAGGVGVVALHARVGFSGATLWGLVGFGLGHLAGGMVPVGDGILYQWWLVEGLLRYDNLQHAWGFGFVGRATWEALRPRLAPRDEDLPFVAFVVIVLGAAALGAVNEVLEYVMTLVLAETNVGGYDNTARDLVANLVGGVLVAGWTARSLTTGERRPVVRAV
jgi:hypothetical protein